VIGVVTMHDLIYDALAGTIVPAPGQPSFTRDILPIFQRLANLQWVNTGFFVQFGYLAPNDFLRPDLLARLAAGGTEFQELRNQIWYMFRDPEATTFQAWQWPPIYGDALKVVPPGLESPRSALSLTGTQFTHLTNWKNGNFDADYDPAYAPILEVEKHPIKQQPATLDCAALTFCLGGPFHPGCEMTWPMRVAGMYRGEFRIRRHPNGYSDPDYGAFLNQVTVLGASGPLSGSGPGDITKWMSVPWHADAASCMQGYPVFETAQGGPFNVDPYLPTFWAARVPNEVLTSLDYQTVMDTKAPLADRIAAFNRRRDWTRNLFKTSTPYIEQLTNMVKAFDTMGVVEQRPGIANDPNFPGQMHVETLKGLLLTAEPLAQAGAPATMTKAIMRMRFGGRRP
jgi:hypothetical protein